MTDDFQRALLSMFGTGPIQCTRCRCPLPDMPGPGVCDKCHAKIEAEERADRLEKAYSSIPEHWRWANFGQSAETMERFEQYEISAVHQLNAFDAAQRVAQGALYGLLDGPSGVGKTSLACAMLRWLIDLDNSASPACRYVFAPSIAKAFRESRFGDTPSVIAECDRASVLLIDDLGADARYRDVVREVIQNREIVHRPTIITTGMSEQEIARPYGDGIARRLFQGELRIDMGADK